MSPTTLNWQTGAATLMWRIDCGPNMASMNSTEINIIAYDWDEDGKAEVALRGADNMIVYGSDGKTRLYTIGDMSVNTRNSMNSHSDMQYAWTHTGAEYLIYINGQTGALYQQMTYPLKRLESGESSEKSAWAAIFASIPQASALATRCHRYGLTTSTGRRWCGR